jgi:hypothetical protein
MTNLNKLFALTLLMTLINVSMYFYSKTLFKNSGSQQEVTAAEQVNSHQHNAEQGHAGASDPSGKEQAAIQATEAVQLNQDMANEEKPERFKSLANLYRPPLFGKCKKLFERFNRKNFPDKPYKAFVYSFDGETAYCADAYTDKGQREAEEIVIRDCEEHHAGSGKYSPCRIYSSE